MQSEYTFRPDVKSESGLLGLFVALFAAFYVVCPLDFAPGMLVDEALAVSAAIAAVAAELRLGTSR